MGVLTGTELFRVHTLAAEARSDVSRFAASPTAPVPVWIGDRRDLGAAVLRARELYATVGRPTPADVGIDLGDWRHDERMLVGTCATKWLDVTELPDVLRDDCSVLVVGTYPQLTSSALGTVLAGTPRARLSVLTGRDESSLAWMTAKQWLGTDPAVTRIGLVSSEADRLEAAGPLMFLGVDDLVEQDVLATLVDERWQAVLFQGHGKDDSINLGEFTICGRNDQVDSTGDLLRPRCGYGLPCYKDESRLVDLKVLRAATVVLSSCNSGPLSDLALYDPKYQLTMNAVDGAAQTVVSAFTVHESGDMENAMWARAAAEGRPGDVAALNASLLEHHPYTSFWRIGLPERSRSEMLPPAGPDMSTRANQALDRCAFWTTTPLLDGQRGLRSRLERFARRTDELAATTRGESGAAARALAQDLQSLDYDLARTIQDTPESGPTDFAAYLQRRSHTEHASIESVDCVCGAPAVAYTRTADRATHPDLHCVVCMRCGDRDFRMAGAPVIAASAPDRISPDVSLAVGVTVSGVDGPVRLGIFVPPYLRPHVQEPATTARLVCRSGSNTLTREIAFDADVPPQAYYFTVFAVQDLALSLHRRHFGISP